MKLLAFLSRKANESQRLECTNSKIFLNCERYTALLGIFSLMFSAWTTFWFWFWYSRERILQSWSLDNVWYEYTDVCATVRGATCRAAWRDPTASLHVVSVFYSSPTIITVVSDGLHVIKLLFVMYEHVLNIFNKWNCNTVSKKLSCVIAGSHWLRSAGGASC